MFVGFDNDPLPPRWEPPEPARPSLTGRQRKVLAWLIGAMMLALLFAPLGGASLVHAFLALLLH